MLDLESVGFTPGAFPMPLRCQQSTTSPVVVRLLAVMMYLGIVAARLSDLSLLRSPTSTIEQV